LRPGNAPGRQGTIINIASIMGMVGIGALPQAAYNTSKGAVINMTRELAAQWAKRVIMGDVRAERA